MLSVAEVQRRRAELDEATSGYGNAVAFTRAAAQEYDLFRDVLVEIEKGWEGHVAKLARAALRPPRGK